MLQKVRKTSNRAVITEKRLYWTSFDSSLISNYLGNILIELNKLCTIDYAGGNYGREANEGAQESTKYY